MLKTAYAILSHKIPNSLLERNIGVESTSFLISPRPPWIPFLSRTPPSFWLDANWGGVGPPGCCYGTL